jgi:hypothetical protein
MDGKTVISRQFEGITLPIEDWIVFAPDSGKIPPGVYTAEVTFTPATAGSAIVMWKDQTLPESYLHRVQIDNAGFKLAYRSPKDQITVWENQSAKPLVYVAPQNAPALNEADAQAKLVAQLDFHHVAYLNAGTAGCESNASFPIGREASAVRSLGITPNAVDVTLEAKSAGTLVYVGSYAKGWMARIDNKPARTFRVNGAFLGTCLPSSGFHQVTFEYRPPLWYPSLAASFGGLLLAGWGWRRRLVARASGGS